jgi:hypothetical protein
LGWLLACPRLPNEGRREGSLVKSVAVHRLPEGFAAQQESVFAPAGGRGRYEEAKARDVAKALPRLLGPGTRWWTTVSSWTFTPARSWKPVTRHTMDTVVVGVGGGVIVTVVAFDDD